MRGTGLAGAQENPPGVPLREKRLQQAAREGPHLHAHTMAILDINRSQKQRYLLRTLNGHTGFTEKNNHETAKHNVFLSPSHLVTVDQLSFSAGSTPELGLCHRVSPARAVTRTSSWRPSADTQAQLFVIVFCRLTHLCKNEAKCPLIVFCAPLLPLTVPHCQPGLRFSV